MTNLDLNEPVVDYFSLNEEYMQLKAMSERADRLNQELKTRPLTQEEQEFMAAMPAHYRRAVDITRILRRTNTGPAKAKKPTKRSAKAENAAKVEDLLSGKI